MAQAQVPAARAHQGVQPAEGRSTPAMRPERGLNSLLSRLRGGWLTPFDPMFESVRMWGFDVKENDTEIVVRAEVPGFEENELNVQLHNDVLTIKADKERKGDQDEEYRHFYQSVLLPPGVEADQVRATYRNGVLELHIPRSQRDSPRQIPIQGQQAAPGTQAASAPQADAQAPSRKAEK
jgi:HSP20 family protein